MRLCRLDLQIVLQTDASARCTLIIVDAYQQIIIFFQASGKHEFFSQDSDKQNAVKNGIFMEKSSQFSLFQFQKW